MVSRISLGEILGQVAWHLWVGRAKHPGPFDGGTLGIEVFNVAGWLTHGDYALDTAADFLVICEHWLIPARVRSEWASLRSAGFHSVWAPASQEGSHVGLAGVGVVSLKGAPLALPSFATATFRRFFELGKLVRCVLPIGQGKVMHLVAVYGFQGADDDAEKLGLTDQLFEAVLCELAVVSRGQPCLLVGDFNVEPTKIPCLLKGISAGLLIDLEAAWAMAAGSEPSATCKRDWASPGGTRRDFVVGYPLAAAALSGCWVDGTRCVQPHLSVCASFENGRWNAVAQQPVRFTPLWPASWVAVVDKSRSSRSAEDREIWRVYDELLQYDGAQDALDIGAALDADDVHSAWLVWSRATESALVSAFVNSGGPVLGRGLVRGRGSAQFKRVVLGGPRVRRFRASIADRTSATEVHMLKDSSMVPFLALKRRLGAVHSLLVGIDRGGGHSL